MAGPPPPRPHTDAARARLVSILRENGYTFDAVKARLGAAYVMWSPAGSGVRAFLKRASLSTDIGSRILTPDRSRLLGRVAEHFVKRGPRDRLDLLIWLFLLNEPVEKSSLLKLFSAEDLDTLAQMNLIRIDADVAASELAIFECRGLFIVTDARVKPPPIEDGVMPLHPDSYDLVAAASRRQVDRTLDLCTGSGVHALVAARHSEHVVATDISTRAIQFATFNAWLNAIANVDIRQGDLWEAARGEVFDLILANPPYIPDSKAAPGSNRSSGGPHGDALSSRILAGLGEHLRPGGLCQMIHIMPDYGGPPYHERVRARLGPISASSNLLVQSTPVDFSNEETRDAFGVRYGVTNVERCAESRSVFAAHAQFAPPIAVDVRDLMAALSKARSEDEREKICASLGGPLDRGRELNGGNLPIRAASFALFCALVAREGASAVLGSIRRPSETPTSS